MNAILRQSPRDDDRRWPDLLVANYPLVEEIVRFVARRHRLTPDDANELGSLVRYKLVEDHYHVLRSFQHRSSIRTYLTTVVSRVWLDWQIERRGKWRPLAGDPSPMTPALRQAPFQAMERLPVTERRLLTLRFVKGWTVSKIARCLGLDQKATYRQFTRIYRGMRGAIETTLPKAESRAADRQAIRTSAAN